MLKRKKGCILFWQVCIGLWKNIRLMTVTIPKPCVFSAGFREKNGRPELPLNEEVEY